MYGVWEGEQADGEKQFIKVCSCNVPVDGDGPGSMLHGNQLLVEVFQTLILVIITC